jgi:hypothetical protein
MSVFTVRVKFNGQVVENLETYRTRPAAAHAAAGLARSAFRDGKPPVSVGIRVTRPGLGCANPHCGMFEVTTSLAVCPTCYRTTVRVAYQPRAKTSRRRSTPAPGELAALSA